MQLIRSLQLSLAAVVVATLAACGGGGGDAPAANGTLRLAMTDAPSCGFDAVNVTVQKVRVHQSGSAGDSDAGWSEVVLNPARRIDLLTLTNGLLDELGQTSLPAGKYTQLRLVLAENGGSTPLANSVIPTGGTETALKTPSGQQSGVKANINIEVAANTLADFVIDFDACKSVVTAGGSGQYLLKPVVTVIPRLVSGVAGFVDPTLVNASTTVSLQQGGVIIKSSMPSSTGSFLLPAAPGTYALVLASPGRTTAIVNSVPVVTATVTNLNTAGAALSPAMSLTGTANGTAPAETFVSALQLLTGGASVDVTGRYVDGTTGQYSHTLPVDAPRVATYVALPASLAFTADTAAAGKYALKASLTGFADKSATLATLTSGATITTNFTFP
ncbi:MAG: DUF4382 domain-containing protein [Pseudomonadota bacterium]